MRVIRNLLNNPWFVAALGIFAVVYLGVSLILPIISDEPVTVAEVPPLDVFGDAMTADVASLSNVAGVTGDPSMAGREAIGWLYDIERDPFSGGLVEDQAVEPEALPTLGALFVGAGVQAAVVNDKLVRVGDRVDKYLVTEIGAQHVVLKRGNKNYRLEPEA